VRVIAINRSIELVPWADVLYAADAGFWRHYANARAFTGWRFCADKHARYMDAGIYPVTIARDKRGMRVNEMIKGPIGTVGAGGNSGFQAVNLAVQFGASRILLCLDYRGKHWHPDHPTSLRNPDAAQLRNWANFLDGQAATLRAWGVEVVNVAKNSALRAFPYADSSLFNPDECALPA
jgi:hypothetical protein